MFPSKNLLTCAIGVKYFVMRDLDFQCFFCSAQLASTPPWALVDVLFVAKAITAPAAVSLTNPLPNHVLKTWIRCLVAQNPSLTGKRCSHVNGTQRFVGS